MRKERIDDCKVARLELNEGQLPWLPRNPRLWTQEDIDGMKASIAEDPDFIIDRPVLAVPAGDGDKLVVFAHNLYTRAVTELKIRTAPVVVYYPETDTDRETIRRRAMKDNGSLGSWDWEALANEWDDLPLTDWGIPAWPGENGEGAGENGSNDGGSGQHTETHEDKFDANKDGILVRCKPGDIWQLGDHRLCCGDSTDLETVKKLMGGAIADISFFSPPYNTGGIGKNLTKPDGKTKYLNDDDNMKRRAYSDFLNRAIQCAAEVSRFTFCNIQLLANNKGSLLDLLNENMARFADAIVWDKGRSQPQLAANVLNSEYEFVFVFSDSGNRAIGTRKFHGTLKNIVHINPGHNEYSGIHNAVFPVSFPAHFIENFSTESVLDLFGGTGTTLIAAEQLGRRCYMMEIDPHYCDVILARWEKETGRKAEKIN